MTLFNTGLPSIRQVQTFIKNKTPLKIVLNNNEEIKGIIQWQDQNCICVISEKQQKVLIWFQAIAYLKQQ
jgi:host factor-I protein